MSGCCAGEVRPLTGSQRCWWRGLASSIWSRRSWLQHGMHYQALPDSKPHCRGAGEREKRQYFVGCTDSHHREGSTQRSEYVDRRHCRGDSILTITVEHDRGRLEVAHVRHRTSTRCQTGMLVCSHSQQVKGSDWLGDQDAIHYMCREAPNTVIEVRIQQNSTRRVT